MFRRQKKEIDDIAEVGSQIKEVVTDSPEASSSSSIGSKSNINAQSDSDHLHQMRGDNTLKYMFDNIASQKSKYLITKKSCNYNMKFTLFQRVA